VPKANAARLQTVRRPDPTETLRATSDLSLILDDQGLVLEVFSNLPELPNAGQGWIRKPWLDTVTSESRIKIQETLTEAMQRPLEPSRWRHINQLMAKGAECPVLVCAIWDPETGQTLVLGRDLRSMASLQSRLVQAQQLLEQDYLRMRSIENQYRTLFDLVRDPVLLIEARHGRVLESNKASQTFFGQTAAQLADKRLESLVSAPSLGGLSQLLREVEGSGRPAQASLKFSHAKQKVSVHLAHLRHENETAYLLRIELAPNSTDQANENHLLQEALAKMSDGLVVTDRRGVILHANPAFAQILQCPHHAQVLGQPISRWLGRANTDLQVLLNSLQTAGGVRLFSTQLISDAGATIPAEISGVSLPQDKETWYAFTIRDTGRRLEPHGPGEAGFSRSQEDLSKLVGRMPLKDIVGETVDLIEKLCIEAALKLTKNNRASAADMLGLSRQSLYVKMRRFGLERGETS
jgi:transcriptional regulator PpsR